VLFFQDIENFGGPTAIRTVIEREDKFLFGSANLLDIEGEGTASYFSLVKRSVLAS
jgi:hypothetical protein